MNDNPFSKLGLGEGFTPTPCTGYGLAVLDTPAGKLAIVAFHLVTGVIGVTLEEADGLNLSNQIREGFGSIVVAPANPGLTLP